MSEFLPRELVFEEGHLTEIGLSALADGEDALLPADVREHAATCEACGHALHALTRQSVLLTEALRAPGPVAQPDAGVVPVPAPVAGPTPWAWLATGMVLSTLGVVVGAAETPIALGDRLRGFRNLAGALARALRAAVLADFPPAVTFVAAALLVASALVVMRASPITRTRVRGDRPLTS